MRGTFRRLALWLVFLWIFPVPILPQVHVPVIVPDPAGPFFSEFVIPSFLPLDLTDSIQAFDLDGNGRDEMFINSSNNNKIIIFPDFNNSLNNAIEIPVAFPKTVVPTDIDLDGKTDLVVSQFVRINNLDKTHAIRWLRQTDNGFTFSDNVPLIFSVNDPTSISPVIAIEDLTHDGLPDILVNFIVPVFGSSSNVFLMKNKGDGIFERITDIGVSKFNSDKMIMHDLNVDGNLDLIMLPFSEDDTKVINIYQGNVDGTFSNPTSISGINAYNLEVLHPRSGLPSILIHDSDPSQNESIARVLLYKQSSEFMFEPADEISVGVSSFNMKVLDSDEDGIEEVFVSNGINTPTQKRGFLQVMEVVGDRFQTNTKKQYSLNSFISGGMAFTDFSGDAYQDIVMINPPFVYGIETEFVTLMQIHRVIELTPTPTATFTNTATPTETPTPTFTLTPSPTFTPTETFTSTATETHTPAATATDTSTPSFTSTATFTATNTPTFTLTATATPTPTPTFTPTLLPTSTHTATPTFTSTSTPTEPPSPTIPPTIEGEIPFSTGLYTRLDIHNAAVDIMDVAAVDLDGNGRDELYLLANADHALTSLTFESETQFSQIFHSLVLNSPSFLLAYQQDKNRLLVSGSRLFSWIDLIQLDEQERLLATQNITLSDPPESAYIADYNDDDMADIVVMSENHNAVFVMEANGLGGFHAPIRTALAGNTINTQVLEHTGKNNQQFISLSAISGRVTLQRILENGALFPVANIMVNQSANQLLAGFFDEDGLEDVLTFSPAANHIDVLLTNQFTEIRAINQSITGSAIGNVLVHDMNLDGVDDIVSTDRISDDITIRLSNKMDSTYVFPVSTLPHILKTGDVNGDKIPDFLSVSELDDTITVYISRVSATVKTWVEY